MRWALALGLAVVCSCAADVKAPARRFEVRRVGDEAFELITAAGQLPYCLAFTTSAKGVVRQLTMTHENKSVRCEAGQPIGGTRFRAPVDEGPVKVHVLFSDQKLNAASVGQQLFEQTAGGENFSVIDLRVPGQVFAETQEFSPAPEKAASVGAIVTRDAGGP